MHQIKQHPDRAGERGRPEAPCRRRRDLVDPLESIGEEAGNEEADRESHGPRQSFSGNRDVTVAPENGSQQAAGHRDRGQRAGGISQADIAAGQIDRALQSFEHRRRPPEPRLAVDPAEETAPVPHGQMKQNQARDRPHEPFAPATQDQPE